MLQSRFFKFLAATLLIFLIVLVGSHITFIFRPLVVFFQTLFIPFLIAGVLFYLLRPIVNLLHSYKVPRTVAILLIYIILIALITLLVFLVGPVLQRQVMNLVNNAPMLFDELRRLFIQIEDNDWLARFQETENFSLEEVVTNFTNYMYEAFDFIATNVAGFIGLVTNVILVLIIIPFVLFYLLKDGNKGPKQMLRLLPEKQQEEGLKVLRDMDDKLASYIQGQVIVSVCVGVLMYIAFLIIGIDYSLILALVAMFTNIVPFIGPWIGTIPAVIVALIDSPIMVLWVVLAIVIVQQIESNLISPQVMGRKLAVHPLTIIILILVGGRFAGFFGLILAVPLYAITKVVISHFYRLIQLRKSNDNDLNS
ncbi:AI-2E family transporter [Salipaludibacillus agaradhaerens]|uniref:AI-2E family transporter n=1 Tax=Salipaludibacillus agaradhaerens TaxID=76935 RepID=A0A9Q4FVN3_SALAG|nr:AI-2E family transporter [Salipaludibacillus agaradhaerens]MCR6095730.1 AI-2E family transporter [Salipaludibacillus agaradhaerens]MCR6114710.1 AI-2E family transporter [Salipaludibacillus agaradhaerens]